MGLTRSPWLLLDLFSNAFSVPKGGSEEANVNQVPTRFLGTCSVFLMLEYMLQEGFLFLFLVCSSMTPSTLPQCLARLVLGQYSSNECRNEAGVLLTHFIGGGSEAERYVTCPSAHATVTNCFCSLHHRSFVFFLTDLFYTCKM